MHEAASTRRTLLLVIINRQMNFVIVPPSMILEGHHPVRESKQWGKPNGGEGGQNPVKEIAKFLSGGEFLQIGSRLEPHRKIVKPPQSRPFRPPVKPKSEPVYPMRRSEHSPVPLHVVVAAPNGRNRPTNLPLTGFGPLRFHCRSSPAWPSYSKPSPEVSPAKQRPDSAQPEFQRQPASVAPVQPFGLVQPFGPIQPILPTANQIRRIFYYLQICPYSSQTSLLDYILHLFVMRIEPDPLGLDSHWVQRPNRRSRGPIPPYTECAFNLIFGLFQNHMVYPVPLDPGNLPALDLRVLKWQVATLSHVRPSRVPGKVDTPKPHCMRRAHTCPDETKFGCAQLGDSTGDT
ncbi:hypothetical protein CRG98_042421 [Punica granatum]|uniref:Uncharacterized protein n=1 Tax=Punica granatum TaxID=22663 RepID=A0A2I0I0A9_PUNGR|nr:hypothetical protein CRG98_042421 [Punica granatum]